MKRGQSGLNLLVGIDKPVGMTSHDVVNKVRRTIGESRVGHAGTLDPFASGVMVVGIGQATRLMQYATADYKSYVARLSWGRETVTDDIEGETRCEAPVPTEVLDRSWAQARTADLLGMKEQVPPVYSAIKVDGVRCYDAARKGRDVELEARPIDVREARLVDMGQEDGAPWWDVDFCVSKGTYIRALARDLGRMCGSACHLTQLRRTSSGLVGISDCLTLDGLADARTVRPIDPVALLDVPAIEIGASGVDDVRCGRRLSVAKTDGGSAATLPEGGRIVLVYGDKFYAVAERREKAIVPVCVFADGVMRASVDLKAERG